MYFILLQKYITMHAHLNVILVNSIEVNRTTCFGIRQAILRFTSSLKDILRQELVQHFCLSMTLRMILKH